MNVKDPYPNSKATVTVSQVRKLAHGLNRAGANVKVVNLFSPWTSDGKLAITEKPSWGRHELLTETIGHIERSGLTHEEIAERAGVAKTTIYRWVNGFTRDGVHCIIHAPRIDTMSKVIEALGGRLAIIFPAGSN